MAATMAARTAGSSGTSAGGIRKASRSAGCAQASCCPSSGVGVPAHLLHSVHEQPQKSRQRHPKHGATAAVLSRSKDAAQRVSGR